MGSKASKKIKLRKNNINMGSILFDFNLLEQIRN